LILSWDFFLDDFTSPSRDASGFLIMTMSERSQNAASDTIAPPG